jgi:hypothetical protein
MLFWIVDNKVFVLGLFGIMAVFAAGGWWQTRKKAWLIGSGVMLAAMVVVVALSLSTVTDQMQIENNIDAMRDALNNGKPEEASKYFNDEVTVELAGNKNLKLTNKELEALAKYNMQRYGVKKVETGRVDFEELSRPKAVVSFMVRAEDDPAKTGRCRVEMVLTPQGKWRVKTFTVESFFGGQKSPALFWIGGGVPGS